MIPVWAVAAFMWLSFTTGYLVGYRKIPVPKTRKQK